MTLDFSRRFLSFAKCCRIQTQTPLRKNQDPAVFELFRHDADLRKELPANRLRFFGCDPSRLRVFQGLRIFPEQACKLPAEIGSLRSDGRKYLLCQPVGELFSDSRPGVKSSR